MCMLVSWCWLYKYKYISYISLISHDTVDGGEILHQLVDGLSPYNPIIYRVSYLPRDTKSCQLVQDFFHPHYGFSAQPLGFIWSPGWLLMRKDCMRGATWRHKAWKKNQKPATIHQKANRNPLITVKYLQKTAKSDPNAERKHQTFMISLVSWDTESPSWAPRNFGGDRPVYSGLSTETIPIAMGNPEIQRLIGAKCGIFKPCYSTGAPRIGCFLTTAVFQYFTQSWTNRCLNSWQLGISLDPGFICTSPHAANCSVL